MKKNLLLKRLFSVLFLLFISTISWAYDFQVDGIYYNKNSDGTSVAVTYKNNYNSYSGTVVIPSSVEYNEQNYAVTSIGYSAFNGCSGLTSITIPNSVTTIGDQAFRSCSNLTSITIPNSVTSIGDYAFTGCSSLTSVSIPNSVTSIGRSTFSGCTSLPVIDNIRYADTYLVEVVDKTQTSYSIKEGTKFIATAAFSGCSGLTTINIPEGVTSIGDGVFSGCSGLTSINIPEGVTTIGERAFFECFGLTSINVPNSVTSIGQKTFYGCSGLTSVTIENGVTSIGAEAFEYCSSLTSVTIPESVTSIGVRAFEYCSSLTSVTIPSSVTSIGAQDFMGCSGLTSITIPESVTSIGNRAFFGCNFRTIVSKPMQPKGFPDTFSQPVYNHTLLYVPQGTYWDYVFNSEWYRFLHIKEFAFDEVEARQAYMLADTDGTNFTVYNAASDKLVTKEYMHQADETSLGSNWLAEPCGAGMALLNLGAEKYAQISSDGKISLSDTPQELDIEFNDGVATANGRQMMLVLNDDDDITDVVTLRYTPSASEDSFDSNAPIYDLMGRRLQQKPASGYYIQGGKKYFVK